MTETIQCPQCRGGHPADAQVCQWCGYVDPASPLGQQRLDASYRRLYWAVAAAVVVVVIGAVALVTMSFNNSKSDAEDWRCDTANELGIDDCD